MNQEALLKSALIAGVIAGIASALPVLSAVNCLCCAWIVGAGILAAHLYVRASPITVTLGRGIALGLLTGAVAALVETVFSIPLSLALSRVGMDMVSQVQEALEQVPNMPTEVREVIRSLITNSGGLGVSLLVIFGMVRLIIYGLFAMAGGAIGVALFEKRPPGFGSPVPPDYQPPAPDAPLPPEDRAL